MTRKALPIEYQLSLNIMGDSGPVTYTTDPTPFKISDTHIVNGQGPDLISKWLNGIGSLLVGRVGKEKKVKK
jgi:hypothetical protein